MSARYGGVPRGEAWHRDLLDQMSLDVPDNRPPVLQRETCAALEEFLRFRHLVRNLYTWDFDPDKVRTLAERLPDLIARLDVDLMRFAAFLEDVSHADDRDS